MRWFRTTFAMRQAAKEALAERNEYPKPPMTDAGVARAKQIASGQDIPYDDVKKINAFHKRHAKNYSDETDSHGRHTKGRIAIDGWGGLEGAEWAEDIIDAFPNG